MMRRIAITLGLTATMLAASMSKAEAGPAHLDLKEYKQNLKMRVPVSHEILLSMDERIERAYTADPTIAEPIVAAQRQILIIGKAKGRTTIGIWDIMGRASLIELDVDPAAGTRNSPDGSNPPVQPEKPPSTNNVMYEVGEPDKQTVDKAYEMQVLSDKSLRSILERLLSEERKLERDRTGAVAAAMAKQTPSPSMGDFFADSAELQRRVTFSSEANKIKPTRTITIPVSQSRIFSSTQKLIKVVASDFEHQEPFLMSERELALIGKTPGKSTLVITDESGAGETLEVLVVEDQDAIEAGLKQAARFFNMKMDEPKPMMFAATENPPIVFKERRTSREISINAVQPKLLKLTNPIIRTAIGDAKIAEPVVVDRSNIVVIGKKPGSTTLFLWDDQGNKDGIELKVSGTNARVKNTAEAVKISEESGAKESAPVEPNLKRKFRLPDFGDVVIWSGRRADLLTLPVD